MAVSFLLLKVVLILWQLLNTFSPNSFHDEFDSRSQVT